MFVALKAKSDELVKDNKLTQGADTAEGCSGMPLSREEVAKLSHYCCTLETKLCSLAKDDTIKISIDPSVFSYQIKEAEKLDNIDCHLTVLEIREMLRNQWLNVVTLQVWGRYVKTAIIVFNSLNSYSSLI